MKKKTARRIRITGALLFLLYVVGLAYFLFFAERYGRAAGHEEFRYNLVPLREIRRFWENRELLGGRMVFLNLAGNVIIFLPFGAILPVLLRPMRGLIRTAGAGAAVSLLIELLQLGTRVGSFDVDDILLNVLGSAAGYVIFAVTDRIRRRIYYG